MIEYSKENVTNIENEKTHINSILENQKNLKKILTSYMDKISVAIDKTNNPKDIDSIHTILENLKINLDNSNELTSSLATLLDLLNDMNKNIDSLKIEEYNLSYTKTFDNYLNVTNSIYTFIDNLSQYNYISFPEDNETKETENLENVETLEDNKELDTTDLKENTLIISETKQNVVLPFSILDLKQELSNFPDKYTSLQDVIDTCYTKPLSLYKNAPISRFKEALNLIKEKENGTLKQALDLGLELFFNSNLHPAVISACKNLDELDIYLDYLENGEIHNFNCFNVIFDVAPLVVKRRRGQYL